MVWRKQKNIVSWIVGPNEGECSGLITVITANQRHAGIESLTAPRGKDFKIKRSLCCWNRSWATEKEKENVWTICTHASWVEFLQSSEREIEKPGFFTFSVCRERSALYVVDPAHFSECLFTKCKGEEHKFKLHFQIRSNTRRAPWSQIIFHFVWFFPESCVILLIYLNFNSRLQQYLTINSDETVIIKIGLNIF